MSKITYLFNIRSNPIVKAASKGCGQRKQPLHEPLHDAGRMNQTFENYWNLNSNFVQFLSMRSLYNGLDLKRNLHGGINNGETQGS